MRLVFVCPPLVLAGGNKVICALAGRLQSRGIRVTLVAPGLRPHPALRIDPATEVRLVGPAGPWRGPVRLLGVGLGLSLAIPPADVVIATHTSTLWSAYLGARRLGRPLVWFYQDYPEMFRGRPLLALTHRLGPYLADRIAAGSRAGAEWLFERFPGKTAFVGQALYHTEHLWPMARPRPDSGWFRVLAFADERPRKGFSDLLQALGRLEGRGLRAVLWAVTARVGSVAFAGVVAGQLFFSPDDLRLGDLYRGCDVFVFPSRAEGFGLPPLEAMACGAPVVVADSRGVREYAVDGVNALVVPPGDVSALAEAVHRLARDGELAARLSRAGPETAARFPPEPVVERFVGVVSGLLSGKQVPDPA